MATKPVQIDDKLHMKLKVHVSQRAKNIGHTAERYIKEGIKRDKEAEKAIKG